VLGWWARAYGWRVNEVLSDFLLKALNGSSGWSESQHTIRGVMVAGC
jgi:hypothetical protein